MNTLKTILYMGITHGIFTFYLPYRLALSDKPLFDPGIVRSLAFPLWLIGTLVIIWCSVDMVRRGRGTPAHFDPPKMLVINGLYRYVRNPIYLGALLVQLGYIVWFGSGIMISYFLFFVLAYHILIMLVEEPILRNQFGAAYDEYSKNVPRWIPQMRLKSQVAKNRTPQS
jgi:protein-S-isoprenylcysteine O-methyltransferase Ste14